MTLSFLEPPALGQPIAECPAVAFDAARDVLAQFQPLVVGQIATNLESMRSDDVVAI